MNIKFYINNLNNIFNPKMEILTLTLNNNYLATE